jgi:uncharacterized protein
MTALITGASSGIGRELAKLYAADGYDLLLVARRGEELSNLANELIEKYQRRVLTHVEDLSEPNAAKRVYDKCVELNLTIDALVNNAGFGLHGEFVEADQQRLSQMVQVNVAVLVALTGYFLPLMKQRKTGHVLNIASTAAFQPGPLMAVYYATKAFVLSFSEALSFELRNTRVTVTALCPGPTKTGFGDTAGTQKTELFNNPNVLSVERVALDGFRAAKRGKRVEIPGFLNKLLIAGVRFCPRWLVMKIVYRVQSNRQ